MSTIGTPPESVAYVCGRLFAICQDIQSMAAEHVKATFTRQFLSAAASSPATVLPLVLSRAMKRLKQVPSPTMAAEAQALLEEAAATIGSTFPRVLSLPQQGEFHLGLLHHAHRSPLPRGRDHRVKRILTVRGQRVHSIGERRIADTLFRHADTAEYVYDGPVELPGRDGKQIRPDFSVALAKRTLYIEYLGLQGDAEYNNQWEFKRVGYRDALKATDFDDCAPGSVTPAAVLLKIAFIDFRDIEGRVARAVDACRSGTVPPENRP